jgi:hypothetical protein
MEDKSVEERFKEKKALLEEIRGFEMACELHGNPS